MNHSNIVGICVARLQDTASELIQVLCNDLKEAGFCSLIIQSFSDLGGKDAFDQGERNLFQLIPFHKLSALLLFSETIKDDTINEMLIRRASEAGIPVISMQRPMEGCHLISYDTLTPFRALTDHIFTDHGCKRVAFMAGFAGNPDSEARLEIYRQALAERNIPYEEELVQYGDFWESPTIAATERLLSYNQGKPPIEAIICANDTMAMTVANELNKQGLNVPKDILLTGCDGIAAEEYFIPRLSTAACDYNAISSGVLHLLVKLKEKPQLPLQDFSVPYGLRVSQSCGCCPVGNPNAGEMLMTLSMQLNSLRAFRKELHNTTVRLLDEDVTPDSLPYDVMQSGWGLARYQTSLVLFRNTMDGLGIFPKEGETGKNAYEFCCWGSDDFVPDYEPFSPKELLPHLETMYDVIPSKAIMVTLLHEQTSVFGYFVTGFEPNGGDYSFDTLDYGRLLDYQMSLAHVLGTLMHRRSLVAVNSELERLYVHDSMTGLFNRRGFFQRLNYLISQAEKDSHLFIAAIDMDGLKYINDTFGHGEGDIAIIAIAKLIMEIAPEDSAIARFGGDEFMIAMLFPTDQKGYPEQFRITMEKALERMNQEMQKPYSIGASCGIEYCAYNDDTDIDQLMKSADNKLYVDKARHKCLRSSKRKP